MTYTHLTPNELVMIEAYFNMRQPVTVVSKTLNRSRQTIYNVYNYLKSGKSIHSFYKDYQNNKKRCGRRSIVLPEAQQIDIKKMVAYGWTPDVIIGRANRSISCSVRTLYRQFKAGVFDCTTLPMKGKRKENGQQERRGKQPFKRNIAERILDYPEFYTEFGHLEGDTIGLITKVQ